MFRLGGILVGGTLAVERAAPGMRVTLRVPP
jgi:hypothetical protein